MKTKDESLKERINMVTGVICPNCDNHMKILKTICAEEVTWTYWDCSECDYIVKIKTELKTVHENQKGA